MTDLNKADQIEVVETFIANNEDLPLAKIRAHIELNDEVALSQKELNDIFKENGLTSAKPKFAASFYEWLAAEGRDKAEVLLYVEGRGDFGETTENVQKHLKHYVNIADLVRDAVANALAE